MTERIQDNSTSDTNATALSELEGTELGKPIMQLAGSMLIGFVSIASVGVVDAYFIGKLGALELSTFGTAMPVLLLLQAVIIGFATGVATHVAFLAGALQAAGASRLLTHGTLLAVPVGLVVWLLGLPLEQAVFAMLRSGPRAHDLAHAYFAPTSIAMGILAIPLSGTFALRALGRAAPSALVMSLAAIVNLILCPVLVLGVGPFPELGIAGAGWATVAANCAGAAYTLWFLRSHLATFKLDGIGDSARRIAAVAVPAAFATCLAPLGAAIVIRAASFEGVAAIAAMSVIGRLNNAVVMVPTAISTAVQPFVGQFWGAGKPVLARRALQLGRRGALVYGVGAWLLLTLVSAEFATAFCHEPDVAALVRDALPWTAFSFVAAAVTNTGGSSLVAIGRVTSTLAMSLSHSLIFLPLFIYIFFVRSSLGMQGLFYALPTADLASVMLCTYLLRITGLAVRRHPTRQEEEALAGLNRTEGSLRGTRSK